MARKSSVEKFTFEVPERKPNLLSSERGAFSQVGRNPQLLEKLLKPSASKEMLSSSSTAGVWYPGGTKMDTHYSRVKYGISATPVKDEFPESEKKSLKITERSTSKERLMRSKKSGYLSPDFMSKHLNSTKARNKNTPGPEDSELRVKSFRS